jgi:hypothetical protein
MATEGRLEDLDTAWARLSKEATALLQSQPEIGSATKETPCEP